MTREFPEETDYTRDDFAAINWELSNNIISNIRMHPKRYDWMYISYYRTITEDFMREFKDYIIWKGVCLSQKMSKEFIMEFIDKIDFNLVIHNNDISKEVKDYCRMFL